MFREMRRKKQILTPEKSIEILKNSQAALLTSFSSSRMRILPKAMALRQYVVYFGGTIWSCSILTPEKSIEILKKGTSGVLALSGDDGYPYAVPLSYVYENSMLYFHGAKEGHKIDAIRTCDKASFCVVEQSFSRIERLDIWLSFRTTFLFFSDIEKNRFCTTMV